MSRFQQLRYSVIAGSGSGALRQRLAFSAVRFVRGLRKCSLAALLLLLAGFAPGALAEDEAAPDKQAGGAQLQSELSIDGWQGAKNYSESFPITIKGGSVDGQLRFLCGNCTVSPATGTLHDSYTVTVKGAGTYSLTAILSGDGQYAEVSDSKRGVGGKTDQAPLFVDGWGTAKGYYRTFAIKVTGGSLNNAITFQTDGCTVSPATGPCNSQFTVTVTRVGAYSLTAVMDGDKNHNSAYSAVQSGVACKSSQSAIRITGWQENACYGDTMTLDISGGLQSEALTVTGQGCTVTPAGGSAYEVTVDTVGPYSVTATRAGNYGYNGAQTCVSGISRQASQPKISISGWSETRNVGDTFSIRILGGAADGAVHFATSGCTVSPLSGTTDTDYFVTVGSVGAYTLIAYVDDASNYSSASSREVKGMAQKAPQPKIAVDNWNGSAAAGSSFDIRLVGGMGTGATSITTYGGCTAVLKSPSDSNVYTVTVTAGGGEPYGLKISKLGDANYFDAAEETLEGVAAKGGERTLSVNGWKEDTQAGEAFAIHLEGSGEDCAVSFEAVGCTIDPSNGTVGDIYTVTVTAEEGDSYSLSVKSDGEGGYAHASVLKSGSVRPTVKLEQEQPAMEETETPMLGNNYDVWVLLSMVATLIVLLSMAMILQYRQRRYYRRRRR